MKLWLLSSIGPPLCTLCAGQPSFLIVRGTEQPGNLEENNTSVVALVYLGSLLCEFFDLWELLCGSPFLVCEVQPLGWIKMLIGSLELGRLAFLGLHTLLKTTETFTENRGIKCMILSLADKILIFFHCTPVASPKTQLAQI